MRSAARCSSAPVRTNPDGHDPHAAREAQRYAQPIASREMILQVLAAEAGVPADDVFLAQGQAMLQRMHEEGTVLGTRL